MSKRHLESLKDLSGGIAKLNQAAWMFFLSFVFLSAAPVFAINEPLGAATAAAIAAENPDVITLDFKDADIKTVLRVMSLKSKVNIVAGPEVQGVITIRLENVPWEKALEVVLRTYGYVYERDGNIIRVTTRENLALEPVTTQTYILNYTKAAEVLIAVKDMLTERGRIQTADRTNTLIISDIPTNLYRMGEVIKKLDQITPQAYIDSKVVKTDVGTAENLGVEWKTGGSQNDLGSISGSGRPTTFPFQSVPQDDNLDSLSNNPLFKSFANFFPITAAGTTVQQNTNDIRSFPFPANAVASGTGIFEYGTMDFSNFNVILQMLKTRSNTKVVSNPRIVVLNNQSAKVQVGSDIPLPTFERNESTGSVEITGFTYREVGVVLNVTPHINSQEEILVDLSPEVSSKQSENIDFGDFEAPAFDVTKAETQVLIRSGETIAIGGLMTDAVGISESKVPYLSDIPLVGKLFRSKRQTAGTGNAKVETLFFVTVTMVDSEGQPTGDLADARNGGTMTQAKAGQASADAAASAGEHKVETQINRGEVSMTAGIDSGSSLSDAADAEGQGADSSTASGQTQNNP